MSKHQKAVAEDPKPKDPGETKPGPGDGPMPVKNETKPLKDKPEEIPMHLQKFH